MQHKFLQHLIIHILYSYQTQVYPAVEDQPNTIVLVRFPINDDCKIIYLHMFYLLSYFEIMLDIMFRHHPHHPILDPP